LMRAWAATMVSEEGPIEEAPAVSTCAAELMCPIMPGMVTGGRANSAAAWHSPGSSCETSLLGSTGNVD
jgi:hypothetical protein